jgi:uncharacterized protein (TIGR02118 family)
MFHKLYFFGRKPSLNQAGFDRHYLAVHTTAGPRIAALKRYIQNHRLHSLGGDSPFDAMSEFWVEDLGVSDREKGGSSRIADEINFIDAGRTQWMTATDRVIVDGRLRSGMIQGVFQLRRKLGLPLAEFRSYWLQVHAPIVQSLPRLRHYQQCLVLDDYYGYGEPYHDGVEEIWFDDYDAALAAMNCVEYQRGVAPDFANFCESAPRFFAESQLVIWPGKGREQSAAEIKAKVAQGWRA